MAITDIDRVPEFAKTLQKKWKIYKKVEVFIPAGGVHKHTRVVKLNKYLSRDELENLGGGSNIAKLTTGTMIVQRGGIVDDTYNASISESKMAIIYKTKYNAYALPSNTRAASYSTGVGGLETERHIPEDLDTPGLYAET